MNAIIHVYTFKDGLLSKLAHDLLLRLERFDLTHDGQELRVVCDTAAWTVVCAMHNGAPTQSGPSESDRAKIVQNIRETVLRVGKYPQAHYRGSVSAREAYVFVNGTLELCGVTLPLSFTLERSGTRLSGSFELIPSHFGIKPYRALGGALKVQDRVRIQVEATLP